MRGDMQKEGIDYNETYAPTATKAGIRLCLAMAVTEGMNIKQYDFERAFLNAPLEEKIYVRAPKTSKYQKETILELLKSSYGLKQSGHNWYETLDRGWESQGLKKCFEDPAIYRRKLPEGKILLFTHVDDTVSLTNKPNYENLIMKNVGRNFTMTDLGPLSHCLGIDYSVTEGKLITSQEKYTKECMKEYGLRRLREVSCPMDTKWVSGRDHDQKSDNEEEEDSQEDPHYRGAIGSMLFAAVNSRVDIAFATGVLSRFSCNPPPDAKDALKRLVVYTATKQYTLEYSKERKYQSILTGFCDASHAQDYNKSTMGYLFFYKGNLISWKSGKIRIKTTSAAESEVEAIAESTKEGLWLAKLIAELSPELSDQIHPIPILTDSQAAISQASKAAYRSGSKHFSQSKRFVYDQQKLGHIQLQFVTSKNQLADFLTKPLSGPQIEETMRRINEGDIPEGMILNPTAI